MSTMLSTHEKASTWLLEQAQEAVEAGRICEGEFRELCDAAKHLHARTVEHLERKNELLSATTAALQQVRVDNESLIRSLQQLNAANERRVAVEHEAADRILVYYERVHEQLRTAASSGSTKDVLALLKVACVKRPRSEPPASAAASVEVPAGAQVLPRLRPRRN